MKKLTRKQLENTLKRFQERQYIEAQMFNKVESDYDKFCKQFVDDLEIAIRCIEDCLDEYYK